MQTQSKESISFEEWFKKQTFASAQSENKELLQFVWETAQAERQADLQARYTAMHNKGCELEGENSRLRRQLDSSS